MVANGTQEIKVEKLVMYGGVRCISKESINREFHSATQQQIRAHGALQVAFVSLYIRP